MAGGHGDYVNDVRIIAMSTWPDRPAGHDFSHIDWQAAECHSDLHRRYLKLERRETRKIPCFQGFSGSADDLKKV